MKTMQSGNPPSKAPKVALVSFRIESAPAQRGEIAYSSAHSAWLTIFTTLTFAVGVISIWVFGFAFWAILEGMARAFGWGSGVSVLAPILNWLTQGGLLWGAVEGWRFDTAVVLGISATWALLYFVLDHLAFLGNRRAQRILERKNARILREQNREAPEARSFVEIRSAERKGNLIPDIGCLSLFAEYLLFVGEEQIVTIPREVVAGSPVLHRSVGGLTGAFLSLPLKTPYPSLRFVARDTANSLSSTAGDTQRLNTVLQGWLHEED